MRELGARIELKGRPDPINRVGRFFNVGQYSFWCRWLIPEAAVRSEGLVRRREAEAVIYAG